MIGDDPEVNEVTELSPGQSEDVAIDASETDMDFGGTGVYEEALAMGLQLRNARESEKMSLDDISDRLKLLPSVITSLENGDFDSFGERRGIYIDGHYRSYAKLVGVDISDTQFAVDRARPKEREPIQPVHINYQASGKTVMSERLREHSDAIIFGLVAIMILAVAGIAWWVWPTADDMMIPTAARVIVTPAESTSTTTTEGGLPFYLREDPQTAQNTVPGDTNLELEANEDAVISAPETSANPIEPALAESERSNDPEPTPVIQTGTLVLSFKGPSWTEVYGVNRERLYYKIGRAGEVTSLVGLLPLSIRIGDSSVVDLRFNESAIDLEPFTVGKVANLVLP